MSVKSILKTKGAHVVTVKPTLTVEEAAWVMRESNIGALVIADGERVLGLLTQRDLAIGLAEYGGEVASMEVRSVMRRSFIRVPSTETAKRVMALMTLHRSTHIPVMDDEKLVGIVSIGDIVKDRLDDLELETNVLRDAYIAAH